MSSPSVKTALLIRLSTMQMYATNYEDFNYYKESGGLLHLRTTYLGLNRVVYNPYKQPNADRTGRGLCSVCMSFMKQTVKELHGVDI